MGYWKIGAEEPSAFWAGMRASVTDAKLMPKPERAVTLDQKAVVWQTAIRPILRTNQGFAVSLLSL